MDRTLTGRLRWMMNKNPVYELYLNILKYSMPIEKSIKEEILKDKMVMRIYKICLDCRSPHDDSYFILRG